MEILTLNFFKVTFIPHNQHFFKSTLILTLFPELNLCYLKIGDFLINQKVIFKH